MNLNIFRRAFSLTELLIVLVIIAVLFAAAAPIITKRHDGSGKNVESVWRFSDSNSHDAYFDSEVYDLPAAAYVGVKPEDLSSSDFKPYSKVVLKAVKDQNQIQFRYGEGDGVYTGTFVFDNNGNLKTVTKNVAASYGTLKNNTAAGVGSMSVKYTNPTEDNTAIGARALSGGGCAESAGNCRPASMIAVGVNAGESITKGASNVLVGANTGRGEKVNASGITSASIQDTVAVGANILGLPTSSGVNNVYAGALVASAGFGDGNNNNTILGSSYYGTQAKNNTIIGYDAYVTGNSIQNNITVVGQKACSSVDVASGANGSITCLGYSSAQNKGYAAQNIGGYDKTLQDTFNSDNNDHIYIGGSPNGFGGRSLLEVHNFSNTVSKGALPNLGPTVVLNSNLAVRGNLYFANDAGQLVTHDLAPVYTRMGTEKGKDSCCRRRLFGRSRVWKGKDCFNFWKFLLSVTIGAIIAGVTTAIAVATGGAGAGVIVGSILAAQAGGGVAGGFFYDIERKGGYSRPKDPVTFNVVSYEGAHMCADKTVNYPASAHCPELKLSDIRLKENISDNTDAIEKIMLVMPYNYSYKADNDNTPQVGVIAQDLQKYFPNSVSEDNNGYLQIRKDELFFATINSIKSLNSSLQNISNDIESLEKDSVDIEKSQISAKNRIEKLNKRINKLEK